MDIVYIVRNGDNNEDLRKSLRSIDKFAPYYDNIWICGYKPDWVADNVGYINTQQSDKIKGWINARTNIIEACKCKSVSDDFVLMNDDFILTRPIQDWNKSLSKILGTFEEQIQEFKDIKLNSEYTRTFKKLLNLIQELPDKETVYNYESHIPMIINKDKMLEVLTNPRVIEYTQNNLILLYRSLYGNIHNVEYTDIIKDVKFKKGDQKSINTEWISVFDDWIGNYKLYPQLNWILDDLLPTKCIYEK